MDALEPHELRRLLRAGELVRVRRGAYASSEPIDRADQHRRLVRATVPQCSSDAVVSHASAAVLHQLPLGRIDLDTVHLTRDQAGGGRRRGLVHVHAAPIGEDEVTVRQGVRVTTAARTVVDLACTLPRWQAVTVGDAALRADCTPAELADSLTGVGRRTGIGSARRVIPFLDRRSESPGESVSRLVLHEQGLPAPVPQFEVTGRSGEWVARCDFAWPSLRTLGEFDGRVKYGRALRGDGDLEEVLWKEKCREDALRELGWEIVRWVWADLWQPTRLVERLERAFARAAARSW